MGRALLSTSRGLAAARVAAAGRVAGAARSTTRLLELDRFSRADNPSALGLTDFGTAWGAPVATASGTPSAHGISGSMAYSTDSGLASFTLLGRAMPASYRVGCDLFFVTGAVFGIALAGIATGVLATSLHYVLRINAGSFALQRFNGSSYASVSTTSITAINGATYRIEAEVTPTSIRCLLNGVEQFVAGDTTFRNPYVGIRNVNTSGAPVPGKRWDNFLVEAL